MQEFRLRSVEWEQQRMQYQRQVSSLEEQRKNLAEQFSLIQVDFIWNLTFIPGLIIESSMTFLYGLVVEVSGTRTHKWAMSSTLFLWQWLKLI